MSLFYDCAYIEADKKIDIIKDYLNSPKEHDIDKIGNLADDLEWFTKYYINKGE